MNDIEAAKAFIEKHGPIEYEDGTCRLAHKGKMFVREEQRFDKLGNHVRWELGIGLYNFEAVAIFEKWLVNDIVHTVDRVEDKDFRDICFQRDFDEGWFVGYFGHLETDWHPTLLQALIAAYEQLKGDSTRTSFRKKQPATDQPTDLPVKDAPSLRLLAELIRREQERVEEENGNG